MLLPGLGARQCLARLCAGRWHLPRNRRDLAPGAALPERRGSASGVGWRTTQTQIARIWRQMAKHLRAGGRRPASDGEALARRWRASGAGCRTTQSQMARIWRQMSEHLRADGSHPASDGEAPARRWRASGARCPTTQSQMAGVGRHMAEFLRADGWPLGLDPAHLRADAADLHAELRPPAARHRAAPVNNRREKPPRCSP